MSHSHRYKVLPPFYCNYKYLFRRNLRFVLQTVKGCLDDLMYMFEDMELLQKRLTRLMQKCGHGLLGDVTKCLFNPDQALINQINTSTPARLGRPVSLFGFSTGTWTMGYLKKHE